MALLITLFVNVSDQKTILLIFNLKSIFILEYRIKLVLKNKDDKKG